MTPRTQKQVCIIGCGRWLRRHDQAGLCVVNGLAQNGRLPSVRTHLTESPAADIPGWLSGAELLILVDAARASKSCPPGAYERIDYRRARDRIRRRSATDTHGLSVDLGLSLSEALGTLPKEVWIYAIAVEDGAYGDSLSPDIAAAIPKLQDAIIHDVREWLAQAEPCHA